MSGGAGHGCWLGEFGTGRCVHRQCLDLGPGFRIRVADQAILVDDIG